MTPTPFDVPEQWAALIEKGEVVLKGVNFVWTATQTVAAHLQETGGISKVTGAPNPLAMLVGQTPSAISSMLGTAQLLSGASLATSLVGIGVSVAGFAMIAKRLDRMQEVLSEIDENATATRREVDRQARRSQARDEGELQGLLYRAEEAWTRSDRFDVWRELDRPLTLAQSYWRSMVGGSGPSGMFLDPNFTVEEAFISLQAAHQLAAARIQNLLLLDEVSAAIRYAQDFARWHEQVTSLLTPQKVAEARGGTGHAADDARDDALLTARRALATTRETQMVLDQRPGMIQTMQQRGIHGFEFVAELRDRTDRAVLVLPAAS